MLNDIENDKPKILYIGMKMCYMSLIVIGCLVHAVSSYP